MDVLEQQIAAGGWAGPVDASHFALGCALGYCELRHRAWPWRDGRPALSGWYDVIATRPSFRATEPPVG
jgi:glutathione S-transferase